MLLRWTHLVAAPAVAITAMLALGCNVAQPEQPPPALPMHDARMSNGEYRATWPTLGREDPMYLHLAVGPDMGQACNVPAPHFFFDKDVPRPEDADAIESLAQCLNRPDSRDMKIQLVGHADPRGTAGYNIKLAEARAQEVAGVLEAHGVDPARISIASMGATGAVGNLPQYSFGYDRRVDINLISEHLPAGPRDVPASLAAPADVKVREPELPSVEARREELPAPRGWTPGAAPKLPGGAVGSASF